MFRERQKQLLAAAHHTQTAPTRPTTRSVITGAFNSTRQQTQALHRTIISAFPTRQASNVPPSGKPTTVAGKLAAIVRPTPSERNNRSKQHRIVQLMRSKLHIGRDNEVHPNDSTNDIQEAKTPPERPPIYKGQMTQKEELEWWQRDGYSIDSTMYQNVADGRGSTNSSYRGGRRYRDADITSQLSDSTYDDIVPVDINRPDCQTMRESNETELSAATIDLNSMSEDHTTKCDVCVSLESLNDNKSTSENIQQRPNELKSASQSEKPTGSSFSTFPRHREPITYATLMLDKPKATPRQHVIYPMPHACNNRTLVRGGMVSNKMCSMRV